VLIEPRQADPGALQRWSGQAVQLIRRGLGFWAGMMLLVCLAIFAGQRLPLVAGVLALTAYFGSIVIAARLDRPEPATLTDVMEAMRVHGRSIMAFAAVIAGVGALVWSLFLARPGVAWWSVFYTERNVVAALSENWFLSLRQIFAYSAYALGLCYFGLNIPGVTSFFQFPCVALLGVPYREAYRLSAAAQMKNLAPMLAVGLAFVVLPFACAMALPPAVPLLYCFLGALSYVAFRDIFLDIRDNQAVVPAAAPRRAIGGGTRSAV
jgi:hypothetical protein